MMRNVLKQGGGRSGEKAIKKRLYQYFLIEIFVGFFFFGGGGGLLNNANFSIR